MATENYERAMPLTIGSRVGSYEIVAALGAGVHGRGPQLAGEAQGAPAGRIADRNGSSFDVLRSNDEPRTANRERRTTNVERRTSND
jgi:hypothetical protein